MKKRSFKPISIPLLLLFLTAIPVIMAMVRSVQIPMNTLPEETLRLMAAPISFFSHVVAGAGFGILGPIQFGRVLANRFGTLHKVLGRIYVVFGALLAYSGIALLWSFNGTSTPVLDITRGVAGIALGFALWRAIQLVRNRNIAGHRAWMIRSYAIGMGSSGVAFIIFPIYIATGEPVNGLASDMVFVASHIVSLLIGEWAIRRHALRKPAVQNMPDKRALDAV